MELAMERLSTGSRINSAGDDAAGLACDCGTHEHSDKRSGSGQ